MAKEDLMTLDGLIDEILPDGRFRVLLENDHKIIAYTAGGGGGGGGAPRRAGRAGGGGAGKPPSAPWWVTGFRWRCPRTPSTGVASSPGGGPGAQARAARAGEA